MLASYTHDFGRVHIDLKTNSQLFSINLKSVKNAMPSIISDIINHIYENKDKEPYNTAETRVGLALQTLLMGETEYSLDFEFVQPIIDDIEELIIDEDHLSSFPDPPIRKQILKNELNILRHRIHLDDLSLNTYICN